jgi:hypothetical protein
LYELTTAAIAFVCMCAGIALGFGLRAVLKETLNEAKEIVGIGDAGVTGLVVLLSALVLGLLIASATGAFNDVRDGLSDSAAKVSLSGQLLKDYGPDANPARVALCYATGSAIGLESVDDSRTMIFEERLEPVTHKIRALLPTTTAQTDIKPRVEKLIEDVRLTRRNVFEESNTRSPRLLIAILVFWLSTVFTAFALQSPRSLMALCALLVGAFSVSAAIFLVEELNSPLEGLISVSTAPLQRTLATFCP